MSEVETANTAPSSESSAPVPGGSLPEPTQVNSGSPDASKGGKDANGYTIPPSAEPGNVDPVYDALSKTYDEITGENVTETQEPAPTSSPKENTADTADEASPKGDGTTEPEAAASEQVLEGHREPVTEAPAAWSSDLKETWASLPSKAQEYIAKREAEAHQKISQQGSVVRAFQPVIETLQNSPYANNNPAEMLTGLIKAQHVMDTNPAEGLKWLANSYGVDLNTLIDRAEGTDDGFDDLFHDPRVDKLTGELNELKQQNQQLMQAQQTYWQHQQQQVEQARAQEVQKALDTAKEAHPHFDDLREDIAREVKALQVVSPGLTPSQLLDQAYERAFALSPAVQQKEKEAMEARAKQTAAARLAKAKAQQSTNVKSADKVQRHSDKGWDDRDELSAIWDTATSR